MIAVLTPPAANVHILRTLSAFLEGPAQMYASLSAVRVSDGVISRRMAAKDLTLHHQQVNLSDHVNLLTHKASPLSL